MNGVDEIPSDPCVVKRRLSHSRPSAVIGLVWGNGRYRSGKPPNVPLYRKRFVESSGNS